MKFCVMMTAQGNSIVGVQAMFGKENYGQDVMCLQIILSAAASAATVTRPYRCGPFLAQPSMPERLIDATVHVVGVVFAGVQLCEQPGLCFAPFTRSRAVRAVTSPILARLAGSAAYLARDMFRLRVGQRFIDEVQDAFVSSDGPDVPAEVLARLEMGTESATRFRHHLRVRPLARPAAKLVLRNVSAAPVAVLFDHERTLPESGNSAS